MKNIYLNIEKLKIMSFQKDFNQLYNITEIIQNIKYIKYIDFKFDLFLFKTLLDYEPYLFECCIFLTKYIIYYIFTLMLFEFVSVMFGSISLYSSVTRRYINKYNGSLQQIEALYSECGLNYDIICDLQEDIDNLRLENEKLQEKVSTNDQSTQFSSKMEQSNHKLSHSLSDSSLSMNMRQSAKKGRKTIKELVRQKLV